MGPGKALELLMKNTLLQIGFSQVRSDNRYIFDGTAGQMIQGLGDAHNADVLLEPPVQIPFYAPTRLLIECKDYLRPVSLNILRSALGLREDINHFEIVDETEIRARQRNRRAGIVHSHQRYLYQVAVASTSGFSRPAQNFALSHRIPLIEVNKMPFWEEFYAAARRTHHYVGVVGYRKMTADDQHLMEIINDIASKSAVAITNTGQMLFLYRISGGETDFGDSYSLHWNSPNEPWTLCSGQKRYQFQLPKYIMQYWLESSTTDLERKVNAINCKANFFSSMVVYYSDEYGHPKLKMVSIDHYMLEDALKKLKGEEQSVD